MAKTNSALAPIDGFPPALMALDIQEVDSFVDELGKAISETETANQARWRRLAEQFPGQVPTTPAELIDFFASEYHCTLDHIADLDDFQMYAFVKAALQRRKATSRRSARETSEPVNRKKNPGRPADTDPELDNRISVGRREKRKRPTAERNATWKRWHDEEKMGPTEISKRWREQAHIKVPPNTVKQALRRTSHSR